MRMSLRTASQPTRWVRTNNNAVFMAPIDGMTEFDVIDTHFRRVNGLSDSTDVSFESVKYPGRFLRHANNSIRLEAPGWFDYSFNDDATFWRQGYRYEAFSRPGSYLRVSGSSLVLSPYGVWGDYSWIYDTVFYEENPATLGFHLPNGFSGTIEGEYLVTMVYGACTGLTFWGQQPKIRCATALLFNAPPPLRH